MPVDMTTLSDAELDDLRRAVSAEQLLRRKLDASPEKIERAIHEYQEAHGVKDGDPWQPAGSALNRPMKGAKRMHGGRLWRSTIDHNVWEPGVSDWVLEPEIDPETGKEIPPPYHRPSGAHDAFPKGYRITWEDGLIYATTRDGVDWDPGNAPEDWELVEEEPDPEPGEPVEPEPEPTTPEWEVGKAYVADDEFTYQGAFYRVRQGHTSAAHWPPSDVPSLYEVI